MAIYNNPERVLIAVGIASMVFSLLGLFHNSMTLFVDYSPIVKELGQEYNLSNFYVVFYIMSAICITFYVVLFISGIQLIRRRTYWVFVLLLTVIFEIIYFIAVRVLSCDPDYGNSIAAATGISSGGLMFQAFGLFPIWAPIIAFWARRKMIRTSSQGELHFK